MKKDQLMKKKFYVTLLMSFFVLCQNYAQEVVENVSKSSTASADFLNIGMGANAIAMGSSFVAVANDVTTIYWNVAGIARLRGTNLVVDYTDWIGNLKYNYVAMSYNTDAFGTIGFSYTASDIPDMEVTTVAEPEGTNQIFSVKQVAFSFAYALELTDRFAIGFNPKIVYESYWLTRAYGLAFDMGALYDTPIEGLSLGMSITNFGTKMKLEGNSTLKNLDLDPDNSGNNPRTPANLSTDQFEMPLNYKLGVSYKLIKDDTNQLLVSTEVSHPSSNYESMNIGTEYVFAEFLSLRAGYKSLFLPDSEESLTFGGGVRYMLVNKVWVNLNYAYADFGRLNNYQKFSVAFNF